MLCQLKRGVKKCELLECRKTVRNTFLPSTISSAVNPCEKTSPE